MQILLSKKIKKLFGGLYHFLKVNRTSSEHVPRKNIFFAFTGNMEYQPGLGSNLFKNSLIFRNSIIELNDIIIKWGYQDILNHYLQGANNTAKYPDITISLIICATQIAVHDILIDHGFYPNATLGLSQGEIPAIYAAGGITKEEAILAILSSDVITKREEKEYKILVAYVRTNQINQIRNTFIEFVYPTTIMDEGKAIFTVHKTIYEKFSEYLNNCQIQYRLFSNKTYLPTHTSRISKFEKEFYKFLNHIDPKPLAVDYYSSYKNKIPKGSIIDKSHFFKYLVEPVQLGSIFNNLILTKNVIDIVQVGPDLFWKTPLNKNLETNNIVANFHSTLSLDNDKQHLKTILSNIKDYNGEKHDLKCPYELFLKEFSTDSGHYIQNPYPYYAYLNKHGSIHYLPSQNEYFITDFNIIKHVLDNPEMFSNSPYSTFDDKLLGADSKSHKNARLLLMPLFKQDNLKAIEQTVNEIFGVLIENLPINESFNFVDYFSIPLAEKVASDFLGLPNNVEFTTSSLSDKHLYGLEYLEELHNFCERCLREETLTTATGAIQHFLFLEKEGKITRLESISLMRLLWVAATTTTSLSISYAFYTLLENDALVATLRKNKQVNSFINECLRVQSPESNVKRRVVEEVILDGVKMPKDSIVSLSFRAANTNQEYFVDPLNIDLNRSFKKSLAFGSGTHYCLGMAFAKLEIKVVIESLLMSIDEFVVCEENPISYYGSNHFRGLEKLMIVYKP